MSGATMNEQPPACAFEPPVPVSPRLSFKGWLFTVWLAKNKSFVKAVLAPCSAILTGGATIDAQALRFALGVFGLGLLTIAFRLGWDAFDYFISEQTTQEPPCQGTE
ncbi:MAG: hypothetical protein IPP07_29010 [Holophagales bacterium]|nr:hypothetical protein [Holophagales bacterium]